MLMEATVVLPTSLKTVSPSVQLLYRISGNFRPSVQLLYRISGNFRMVEIFVYFVL